jgi:hypothetical protein
MCLEKVDPIVKELVRKEKENFIGYKIFRLAPKKKLRFRWIYHLVQVSKWLNEKNYRYDKISFLQKKSHDEIRADDGTKYRTGFHFYLKFYDALQSPEYKNVPHCIFEIRKIYFRKPITFGFQHSFPVGVSDEIYIHRRN